MLGVNLRYASHTLCINSIRDRRKILSINAHGVQITLSKCDFEWALSSLLGSHPSVQPECTFGVLATIDAAQLEPVSGFN